MPSTNVLITNESGRPFIGAPSNIIISYSLYKIDTNCLFFSEFNNSLGLGGVIPLNKILNPSIPDS